ncbi:unnamed protein product [Paramecium primaurelia]|uniref:Uncharacterized protein n=1 Tax=Paramecium primaurelia TaxID=5886 RepID=A0A8S1LHB1_PARPR|nr:unnamed protein product [Paramecium primaurelia]
MPVAPPEIQFVSNEYQFMENWSLPINFYGCLRIVYVQLSPFNTMMCLIYKKPLDFAKRHET